MKRFQQTINFVELAGKCPELSNELMSDDEEILILGAHGAESFRRFQAKAVLGMPSALLAKLSIFFYC